MPTSLAMSFDFVASAQLVKSKEFTFEVVIDTLQFKGLVILIFSLEFVTGKEHRKHRKTFKLRTSSLDCRSVILIIKTDSFISLRTSLTVVEIYQKVFAYLPVNKLLK